MGLLVFVALLAWIAIEIHGLYFKKRPTQTDNYEHECLQLQHLRRDIDEIGRNAWYMDPEDRLISFQDRDMFMEKVRQLVKYGCENCTGIGEEPCSKGKKQ